MPVSYQPLFNQRFIAKRVINQPTPQEHKVLLRNWADTIHSGIIRKQRETELRGAFIQRFFVELLGYRPFGNGSDWTINDEKRTGSGSADTALGLFSGNAKNVVAPVELKGPNTGDLDAIMPGRHKSPVQQVWEYAMDTPGCHFLLVSNMLEFRLYAVGHTRQVYERFNILELADSDSAYQKFRLLLGADNLLTGNTAQLLGESAQAEKEITEKLYSDYKTWRINLLVTLMQTSSLPVKTLIELVQKLLDRVLFIAFAEDRGLLPARTLTQAFDHRDPYNPRPIWENFQGLFRAIDKGNTNLGIPAYNGGLFAHDPVLDSLTVSDHLCQMFGALGDYDFADDVSVTVLGHIFEQSVSDLEKLKELAGTEAFTLKALEALVVDSKRSVTGKRKADGIVYTPDPITRFIVDETLGTYLHELRSTLRRTFCSEDGNWRAPTSEEKKLTGRKKQIKIKSRERLVEFLFWSKWRETLSQTRVVDPACGSGAFLVAAFDLLDAEYRQVNEQIQAITGNPDLFDINREILNANLYGVDLNPESIEITKLSLWLKTAQHGKPLESLEANLRVGNSVIDDLDYADCPFNWQTAFADVFTCGGFDVVLGNPPYVRMELLTPIKPYLKQNYAVSSERADLYCYFYELGLKLLKPQGRLGYISSSTFFKTGSGEPLRRHLMRNAQIKTLVDFGDVQVFDGVTTYAAVVVMDKTAYPDINSDIRFLTVQERLPESLAAAFSQEAGRMLQSQLGVEGWRLEDGAVAALRHKLQDGHQTLKMAYGSPMYGVKSGLKEAFIVNRFTYQQLIANDPRSAELLKPFLEGKDLKSWRIDARDLWLIYIPKNAVDIEDYPAIKNHLSPYRKALEKRATKQEWFELQQAQANYAEAMSKPKIGYVDLSDRPNFSMDSTGSFYDNTAYFIPSDDWYLLALLSSSSLWFYARGLATAYRGGFFRLFSQYMEVLPIPVAPQKIRQNLIALAQETQKAAEERRDLHARFGRRILTDLAPAGVDSKLNNKLIGWNVLDFKSFHDEIQKQFKQAIPLSERDDWQNHFELHKTKVLELDSAIAQNERAINRLVYGLFKLTAAEIQLLESVLGK